MQGRIEALKQDVNDIQEYYDNHKHELVDGNDQKQKDNQVYWCKKIEQINKKVNALPNSLMRAVKNN